MMRSLYAGVAGLRTHQTKMDVLGNNIANVNTTSFKSQSITFSDLMYQTTQSASGATETKGGINARQIGLGAKSGAINTAIESQGATQTTNNPFDIMITGKAFFVVNNGKENLYTRDGSFYVDGAGNLAMQSNGYFVMGWNAKEDAETGEITVDKNGELTNLQVMSAENATFSPASTTSALISGNIDDNDSNVVSDDGKTITLEFYDNKGYLYTAKFNIKDTGEDHLFSVELTDIIDSNGTKLTEAQMEGISFGNIQNSEGYTDFKDGYYIATTTDPTTEALLGTIYMQSGQTVFENVPAKGDSISTLSDISNLLEKAYPTANTKRYANIKSYEIDSDALNVTFDFTDYSSSVNNATYKSFAMDNTDHYFYTPLSTSNSNCGFGYQAPSEEGGKLSSLNTEMLDKVFGVNSTAYPAIISDISHYAYEYDDDSQVLTIVASKVPEETEDKTSASGLKTKYDDYFVSTPAGTKISDVISGLDTTTYPKGAYYEYNDSTGVLTIYGGKAVNTPANKNISITSTDSTKLYNALISKLSEETALNYTAMSTSTDTDVQNAFTQLTAIQTALEADGTLDGSAITAAKFTYDADTKTFTVSLNDSTNWGSASVTSTSHPSLFKYLSKQEFTVNYASLTSAAKGELLSGLNDDDADVSTAAITYTIQDITGSTGITANVAYVRSTVDASTEIASFNKYKKDINASNSFEYDVPTVVFRDAATKKTGYIIIDEEPEGFGLDEIDDSLLQTIYGVSKADIKTYNKGKVEGFTDDFSNLNDEEFTVSFIAGGKITVKHEQTDENKISEDYLAEVLDDGTVKYTTANDVIAYPTDTTESKTFPMEGYISEILATADTTTKGLLESVFGITDADARAYGSEGYYVIDDEQGIKLYTSKADLSKANKTIQLVFDAATGNIVSANKNETTKKVDLVFDQKVDGLEAFGFQETPGSDRTLGSIEIDFSSVTNYNTNGSSTIKAIKGDKKSLNTGRAVGEMNGITVSTDGTIYATYSNGQTKLLGQIASAEFANASGLAKEGDNLYSSTLNSGDPTIQDITTDGGYMNTGVLEMSNVDLSKEFTEMITTQRGFQANSRIITVSDTLLEELTNLKR